MEENKKVAPKYGNNFRRDRHETQFDTLDLANELKHKVSVYVMNEKHVPKRWRYVNGLPAIDYARKVRDYIALANDIQLSTDTEPEKLKDRKKYQDIALSYCNILQLQLMDIVAECEGATDDNMRSVIDVLRNLTGKIVKWSKSDSERLGKS